jgi:hypothetical protein
MYSPMVLQFIDKEIHGQHTPAELLVTHLLLQAVLEQSSSMASPVQESEMLWTAVMQSQLVLVMYLLAGNR